VISLQAAIVHPEFARGALRVLAKWQATERDDYRDAEPGKIHHELRLGELAYFKLIPHTPYYGTADATPLYLITLHSTWMCTGDKALLNEHLATAERCLEWIDKYGDRDGDGFQEYQTRSPVGYENQGWKDSGEALVIRTGPSSRDLKRSANCRAMSMMRGCAWHRSMTHLKGRMTPTPCAPRRQRCSRNLTRVLERRSRLLRLLSGRRQEASPLHRLKPGQCLWSGIILPDRAHRVVERLLRPDMWSGWGIRTLSADHKSFNPYHYQIGAVWPHDNGFIAQA